MRARLRSSLTSLTRPGARTLPPTCIWSKSAAWTAPGLSAVKIQSGMGVRLGHATGKAPRPTPEWERGESGLFWRAARRESAGAGAGQDRRTHVAPLASLRYLPRNDER